MTLGAVKSRNKILHRQCFPYGISSFCKIVGDMSMIVRLLTIRKAVHQPSPTESVFLPPEVFFKKCLTYQAKYVNVSMI